MNAVERAAALTSQLLAPSRKHTIQLKVMDLGVVVGDLQRVLDRLIGEDIEVTIQLDPQLGRLIVDPDQMHQVLMNLVLKARDAMPEGGRLTITAENVTIDEASAATLYPTGMSIFW